MGGYNDKGIRLKNPTNGIDKMEMRTQGMIDQKRRVLALIAVTAFLTVIFTGCVLESQKALQTETVEPAVMTNKEVKVVSAIKSEQEQLEILKKFDALTKDEKNLHVAVTYVDHYINQLSKPRAADLLLRLETYQINQLRAYQKTADGMDQSTIFDANGVLMNSKVNGLKDGTVKSILAHIEDSGLKIKLNHQRYEPVVDYNFYNQCYSEFMTQEIQEYFKIRSLESERPCFDNDNLAITWQELLDRMQRCESFILSNPDFERVETVKVMYFKIFKTFLYGTESTPVFSVEDGHILDDVSVVYQNMKLSERNAISKKYLKDYFNAVQKSKFKYSEQIDTIRSQMTKELMQELKLTAGSFNGLYVSEE